MNTTVIHSLQFLQRRTVVFVISLFPECNKSTLFLK